MKLYTYYRSTSSYRVRIALGFEDGDLVVHVDDDGTVATVVAVTRVGKKLVRAKLRDDANPRVTLNAEFAPDEVVLTAEPGEADAIDLDKTSSVA